MTNRQLSAYEINRLIKYGKFPLPEEYIETPVAYITGFAEFMDREFVVNTNVLIPRLETEQLAEIVIHKATKIGRYINKVNILDVGTGSGCIGISSYLELLSRGISSQVQLLDISPLALEVAVTNIKRLVPHSKQNGIGVFPSDLLLDLPPSVHPHIVVANLPYIPTSRIETLDSSVKSYEPRLALDGGIGGVSLIARLITQVSQLPYQPLFLALEIDDETTRDKLPLLSGFSLSIKEDQFNQVRFALYQRD